MLTFMESGTDLAQQAKGAGEDKLSVKPCTLSLSFNNSFRFVSMKQRLCDYCNESIALLYCRADSAKLCFSCDREVHSTNPLFVKHSRSQLCDACDESPASIFCEAERRVLCHNCDWETQKPSQSPQHNRRPIEGFTGCPSVTELLGFVGFEGLGNKDLLMLEDKGDSGVIGDVSIQNGFDELLQLFVCEAPSLDDIIVFNGSNHGLRAMDIPPLPKDRNSTCGQHKKEVLCQLRELAKTEANLNNENANSEANIDWLQSLMPDCYLERKDTYAGHEYDAVPILLSAQESRALKGFGDSNEVADVFWPNPLQTSRLEENAMVPDKYVNAGGPNDQSLDAVAAGTSLSVKVPQYELNSQERETAISRYKEKRKTRRYEKHIRYESRKVRAEGRTRIKGRFAKVRP